jgi:hypothetical protein
MRGHRRQALIHGSHGRQPLSRDRAGEPQRVVSGRRLSAGQREGKTHDDLDDLQFARDLPEALKVARTAGNRLDRSRQHPVQITASHTYACRADIDSEPHAGAHRQETPAITASSAAGIAAASDPPP